MNELVGVYEYAKNLLSRIPIRDLMFLMVLLFWKSEIFENVEISNSFTPIYIYK